MPAVIFYLAPVVIFSLIVIFARNRITVTQLILMGGVFWKIVASCIITYIVIHKYDFGDLPTYYTLARDISFAKHFDYLSYAWGSYIPALLNSFIFEILPPSIYGLAVFSGISAYSYNLFLLKSFQHYLNPVGYRSAMIVLMFLPALSLQSGYIGKETYILPALGYIFLALSRCKVNLLGIAVAIFFILLIRPYQGAILIFSVAAAFLLAAPIRKLPLVLAVIAVAFFGVFLVAGGSFLLYLDKISNYGLQGFLTESYHGGNLILSPFPQPFTFLQNFRPFPWEAHNVLALAQSVENLAVLVFFVLAIRLFLHKHRNRVMRPLDIKQKRFLLFASIYCLVNLVLFSYSSNIGDLSRRHVYYFPVIILFGVFSRHYFHRFSLKENMPVQTIKIGAD
jgi:hypothetical protein